MEHSFQPPIIRFGEDNSRPASLTPVQPQLLSNPFPGKPGGPQVQHVPARLTVAPRQQFVAIKSPQHPTSPRVYYQPGVKQIMNHNEAGPQRPPIPSMSPPNMRPMVPPMSRPGAPPAPRPVGPQGSPAPVAQYSSSPNIRPQMLTSQPIQLGMQRPPMMQNNMRQGTPTRPPGVMPQNMRPPVSPQNSITGNNQFIRSGAPPIRQTGAVPLQMSHMNAPQIRPSPIPQQLINNRPPSMPFRSTIQNSNIGEQLILERSSPENMNKIQSDTVLGQIDSPRNSYLSTDDDEDVVIGKITSMPSSRSPEGQTSPTAKNVASVPLHRTDSQASIPSRPPSALGSLNRIPDTMQRNAHSPAQPLQSSEIVYKEKHTVSPNNPQNGLSSIVRAKTSSPEQMPDTVDLQSKGRSQTTNFARIASPTEPPASLGRTKPPMQSTPSSERVTFVLPEETNGNVPREPMRKTPIPQNVLMKLDTESRGRNPNKSHPAIDRTYSPNNNKGDNDSGVDESTQEKERNGPGSPASPLKSPSKIPSLRRPDSITPQTRSRSTSKQRLTAKTPETPTEPLIKKVPMNKIQVGATPSPNLKVVKSKIGSLENATHKPGGGHVKIETKKIDIKAAPRIEAKNDAYVPKGGDKKIITTKLQWNARSKIGSLENTSHKPGGGDKKIETLKTDFKDRAKSKIGSKDNIGYQPGGGDVKPGSAAVVEKKRRAIVNQKLDIKAESKVGSLENVKHKPGGGDIKIFDDKEYLKQIDHPIAPTPPSQSPTPDSASNYDANEAAVAPHTNN
ncbi:microtubule-associated protein tau isoform X2 [Malaya genurostris]|uniref:microtubule-associated protein tau isoform X2 n=1 Tax=Malaya genurostris TaxID=325434 RepID=UPI0026F3A275|nr:microtubule-associated protein tau isoform X2 [Malaya genurostris]